MTPTTWPAAVAVLLAATTAWRCLVAWLKTRESETEVELLDHAFGLAHGLFGTAPWVQITVSRSTDGYVATVYDQTRTIAISSRGYARSGAAAILLLCGVMRTRRRSATPAGAAQKNVSAR